MSNRAARELGQLRMKKLKPEERAALGQSGGHARARNLTKKQLSEIGKKAAAARWGKRKKESS